MSILAGLLGAVVGAVAGGLVTYVTTRSRLRIELEHAYDQALRDKRLAHYQRLFHLSRCLPREWRQGEEPTRRDLLEFREDFHNWYFGDEAGGMFLTQAAKDLYMDLMNALEEAGSGGPGIGDADDRRVSVLSLEESNAARDLASRLRHQMARDVGTAQAPRVPGIMLTRTKPPPSEVGS
jgi:hypothetical protein